jgi:hypothetical protein
MTTIPQSPTTDFTSTTLNGSITDSAITITVNDGSKLVAPCYAVIDREDNNGVATPNQREVIYISSIATNTLTITRGVDNSTARAHNDSAKVEPLITVGFWDDFYDAYDADHNPADGTHDITKVAMLSGATVQTLASKILSSPTIATGSLASPSINYGSLSTVIISSPTIITPRLTLSQGASVLPTVDGDIQWRTGDDQLLIGDSSTTRYINLGAWISYTPTWTNLTVGNSTQTFNYSQIGKTIHVNGVLTYGSTATVSGSIILSLPVTATTNNFFPYGVVYAVDSGTASYPLFMQQASTTQVALFVINAAGTYAVLADTSGTVPFTWAVNDRIHTSFTYEAA